MVTWFEYDGLRYCESDGAYPVREDSLLLLRGAKPLLEEMKGPVCDMGCGTGLLSLMAAKKGHEVVSVDREPRALALLRKNLAANSFRSRAVLSDLFEGVPRGYLGHFALTCFNPPYLACGTPHFDPRADLPLVGGSLGTEVLSRFIEGAVPFMREDGMLLVLTYADQDISGIISGQGLVDVPNRSLQGDIDDERFRVEALARVRI